MLSNVAPVSVGVFVLPSGRVERVPLRVSHVKLGRRPLSIGGILYAAGEGRLSLPLDDVFSAGRLVRRSVAEVSHRSSSSVRISQREQEILELLCQGLHDKEIALVLRMSMGTLRTHISRLFQKTGQRCRAGLVGEYATFRAASGQLPPELVISTPAGNRARSHA